MNRIGRRTRLLQTVALLAVGAAACTSQEAVPPATGGSRPVTTSEVDTTSTTDATAPTTAPAGTTEPTLTTIGGADTTATPDTAPAPPSGRPTVTPTEFFAGGDPDGWLPLGAWTGNAWEPSIADDGTVRAIDIGQGVDVVVHELEVAPIDGTTGAAAQACADGRTGPVISPNARAPEEPGFGYRSVAFAADWESQPRKIASVDVSIDSYVEAGRSAFSDTGVDASGGEIDQIVVSDIDGDGDTEALVAFGGASFHAMLLIDADSGAGVTIARSVAPPTPATTTSTPPADPDDYRILAVADLNGDGLMEIVVHSWSEARSTTTIYTYDGDEVAGVLAASC